MLYYRIISCSAVIPIWLIFINQPISSNFYRRFKSTALCFLLGGVGVAVVFASILNEWYQCHTVTVSAYTYLPYAPCLLNCICD